MTPISVSESVVNSVTTLNDSLIESYSNQ